MQVELDLKIEIAIAGNCLQYTLGWKPVSWEWRRRGVSVSYHRTWLEEERLIREELSMDLV